MNERNQAVNIKNVIPILTLSKYDLTEYQCCNHFYSKSLETVDYMILLKPTGNFTKSFLRSGLDHTINASPFEHCGTVYFYQRKKT